MGCSGKHPANKRIKESMIFSPSKIDDIKKRSYVVNHSDGTYTYKTNVFYNLTISNNHGHAPEVFDFMNELKLKSKHDARSLDWIISNLIQKNTEENSIIRPLVYYKAARTFKKDTDANAKYGLKYIANDRVIKALLSAGYVQESIGVNIPGVESKGFSKPTAMFPTESFIKKLRGIHIGRVLYMDYKPSGIVYMRPPKGFGSEYAVDVDDMPENIQRNFQSLQDYNSHMETFEVSIGGSEIPSDHFKGYIKYNERFDHGGRMYGPWSNMKRNIRKDIRIDDEDTVDIDISACHVSIMYNLCQLDIPENPYIFKHGEAQYDLYKKLLNIIINFKIDYSDFNKSIKEISSIKNTTKIAYILKKGKVRCTVDQLSHYSLSESIRSLMHTHRAISHLFGSDRGMKLMNIESDHMLRTIDLAIDNDIPVILYHDGLMCKSKHQNQMIEMIKSCWGPSYKLKITPMSIKPTYDNIFNTGFAFDVINL